MPKNFVGEPFGVSETFRGRKVLCFRGLCHDFLSKVFCHTVAKNFVEEPFCAVFQKNSGSQTVYGKEGGGEYQELPSKFFCLTVPKNFVGESFSDSLIAGIEKFYA